MTTLASTTTTNCAIPRNIFRGALYYYDMTIVLKEEELQYISLAHYSAPIHYAEFIVKLKTITWRGGQGSSWPDYSYMYSHLQHQCFSRQVLNFHQMACWQMHQAP